MMTKPQCCGYEYGGFFTDENGKLQVRDIKDFVSWGGYKITSVPRTDDLNQYYEVECKHRIKSFCQKDMIEEMKKTKMILC